MWIEFIIGFMFHICSFDVIIAGYNYDFIYVRHKVMSWNSANQLCETRNLTMLTVSTCEKKAKFRAWVGHPDSGISDKSEQFWIAHERNLTDNWIWMTGEKGVCDPPGMYSEGECAVMNGLGNWKASPCVTPSLYAVVCEGHKASVEDVKPEMMWIIWISCSVIVSVTVILVILTVVLRKQYINSQLRRILYIDNVNGLYDRTSSYFVS